MITFKLTFLLSFANVLKNQERFKNKSTEKTRSKAKTPRSNDNGQNELLSDSFTPLYVEELQHVVGTAHLEYELIPNRFKYFVDITCFENIAKISTVDGIRYYKTIIYGNNIWIPATVHHFIKKLTDEDLLSLHAYEIIFSLTSNRLPITKNTTQTVYCFEEEVGFEYFVEYYESNPNVGRTFSSRLKKKETLEEEMQKIIMRCINSPRENEVTTYIQFTGLTHVHMVYNTLADISQNKIISYKEFVPICKPYKDRSHIDLVSPMEVKIDDNKVKKKRAGPKSPPPITNKSQKTKETFFKIPGEIFFTDSKLAVYKLNGSKDVVNNGFAYLSVQNLMTREQKLDLNPFIIKIRRLSKLPEKVLQNYGFKQIYISCDIPDVAFCNSLIKPVEQNVNFNESHAFFMRDIPKIRFLENIKSHRIYVQIRGIKEENTKVHKSGLLFGEDNSDQNISKRMTPSEALKFLQKDDTNNILLAVACFDVSNTVNDVWTHREKACCHNPLAFMYRIPNKQSLKFEDTMTVQEVNLRHPDLTMSKSPLGEAILAECFTTLDMEFHFVAPQFSDMHLHRIHTSYRRLFFVVFNRFLAIQIIDLILTHNYNIFGYDALMNNFAKIASKIPETAKYFAAKIEKLKKDVKEDNEIVDRKIDDVEDNQDVYEDIKPCPKKPSVDPSDILTGFILESGNECLIFLEGLSYGFILSVWSKVYTVNRDVAKVFANSKTVFSDRFYSDLSPVGILTIVLKYPLQEIFHKQEIYFKENIPVPCYNAIHKLFALIKCETFNAMLLYNLFPNVDELISLNVEFGVPLRVGSGDSLYELPSIVNVLK